MAQQSKNTNGFRLRRVAIYTRVSTRGQAEEGHSLGDQLADCQSACDRAFGAGNYTWQEFRDDGYSGGWGIRKPGSRSSKYRPALTEMVQALGRGEYNTVAFYHLNRLSRSLQTALEIVNDHFAPAQVEVICVCSPFDYATAQGRLSINMLATVAQYFREENAERLRDDRRRRREEGYPGLKPPFGWRIKTPEERAPGERANILPDPERAPWMLRMVEWYLSGLGTGRIARKLTQLGVPSPSGLPYWHAEHVSRVLRSPTHAGLVRHPEGVLKPGRHWEHRLYEPETYYRIVAQFERQLARNTCFGPHSPDLLLGLAYCQECGRRLCMLRQRSAGHPRYYRCSPAAGEGGRTCSGVLIPAPMLERAVIYHVRQLASSEGVQQQALQAAEQLLCEEDADLVNQERHLEQRLVDLQRQLDMWADLYLREEISRERFLGNNQQLEQRRDDLLANLAEVRAARENHQARHCSLDAVVEALRDFDSLWEMLEFHERRQMLQTVIDRIDVSRVEGRVMVRIKPMLLPEVEMHVPTSLQRSEKTGPGSLTLRELAALKLTSDGYSPVEIAQRWRCEPENVMARLRRALRQLSVEDVAEAIELARDRIRALEPFLPLGPECTRAVPSDDLPVHLTPRKREALEHLASGLAPGAVAEAMRISRRTVDVMLHELRRIFGVETNDALVEEAVAIGIRAPQANEGDDTPQAEG